MRKLAWLMALIPILVSACHHGRISEIRGSGKRELQKRQVAPFTSIETNGAFHIEVTCQKELSLEVEGDDNVLPLVSAEVSNNVLHLKNTKGYSVNEPIKFKISVPNLEGLAVAGAGRIEIKDMNNETFEVDSDGAPYILVSGKTRVINIDASGAGAIDTNNLRASRAVVESKGVSKIDISVADQLDVTISGPSTVTYRGDPVVNKTVNGPGSVSRRGGEGA